MPITALSSLQKIPYCLYDDTEWHHAPPVSGWDAFLTYVKDQHEMKEPKLYTLVRDELGEPYDRMKVTDDREFQAALQLRKQLFLYEGANIKGVSPRKGKDGLPLMVTTTFSRPVLYNRRGSPSSRSGSSSPSSTSPPSRTRALQNLMANHVSERDRGHCVITSMASSVEIPCNNCHVIAAGEDVRKLDADYVKTLKHEILDDTEWTLVQPYLVQAAEYANRF